MKSKIFNCYTERGGAWFMGALLSVFLLPPLLKTCTFLTTKQSIHSVVLCLMDVAGILLFSFMFSIILKSIKKTVYVTAAVFLITFVVQFFTGGDAWMTALVHLVFQGTPPSLFFLLCEYMIIAVGLWVILQPVCHFIFNRITKIKDETESSEKEEVIGNGDIVTEAKAEEVVTETKKEFSVSKIVWMASAILSIVFIVLLIIFAIPNKKTDYIQESLDTKFDGIQLYIENEQYELAEKEIRAYKAEYLSWLSVATKEGDIDNILANAEWDDMSNLLRTYVNNVYDVDNRTTCEKFETYLLNGTDIDGAEMVMLDLYKEQSNLTYAQEERRDEILFNLALCETYEREIAFPDELDALKEEVMGICIQAEQRIRGEEEVELLAANYRYGGFSKEYLTKLLDASEAAPDNITNQLMVLSYATQFIVDQEDALYERIAAAILRYDSLYTAQYADIATRDEIIHEKLVVGWNLIGCRKFDATVAFVDNLSDYTDVDSIRELSLYAYGKVLNGEKMVALAEQILETEPNNMMALSYAAIGYLMTKEVDTSIERGIHLAEEVVKAEDTIEADAYMYRYMQYLNINDGGVYGHGLTPSFTEEQRTRVETNEFFKEYYSAMDCEVHGRHEEALTHIERVINIKKGLPNAYYLKGTSEFALGEYLAAETSFNQSLQIDEEQATALYALACTYEEQLRYQEAYDTAEQVLNILPTTMHAEDLYGVSLHSKLLMERALEAMQAPKEEVE